MKKNNFGEIVAGYSIPVFNERELRAGAGLLFLFAGIAFSQAFFNQNLVYIKLLIVVFFIDFSIRLFINPKYAPSLILGRIFVSNQKPEYTGAKQKKFAWGLGFLMAASMFIIVIILGIGGGLPLAFCIACLSFLFFEAALGICLGCKMYELFTKEKPQLCPGLVCEVQLKEDIQKLNRKQIITLVVFLSLVIKALFLLN